MIGRQVLCTAAVLALAAPAWGAQVDTSGMPTPAILARAATYDPPKLTALAAKLATQPDMTGLWSFVQPPGACRGPLFDPLNAVCPIKVLEGESAFGPTPGTRVTSIPYNAKYQAIYDKHIKEAQEGLARDTFAACIPFGVPRMVGESPTPFDIIQAPEVMTWHNNYGRTTRRIFLDGRPHPKGDNPMFAGPSYSGHSVGRWEGNALVVETVNMINAFFDETASPHSDKLRMVERIRLIDTNLIENEITLYDEEAFTRPWVVKRYYQRGTTALNGVQAPPAGQIVHNYNELHDRPCVPNVRIDENGFQVMLLPQEVEAEAAKAKGLAPPP